MGGRGWEERKERKEEGKKDLRFVEVKEECDLEESKYLLLPLNAIIQGLLIQLTGQTHFLVYLP